MNLEIPTQSTEEVEIQRTRIIHKLFMNSLLKLL